MVDEGMREQPVEDSEVRSRDRLVGLLIAESVALAIALVSPITPSKTGSTWSPAHFFTPDPTYLEEVAASFVMVNGLLVVIGLIAWLAIRRDGSEGSR